MLLRLREVPLLAARDLVHIRAQLNVETILFMPATRDTIDLGVDVPVMNPNDYKRQIGVIGYGRRILQLFTIPRVRRSTLASFVVMSAQILCKSGHLTAPAGSSPLTRSRRDQHLRIPGQHALRVFRYLNQKLTMVVLRLWLGQFLVRKAASVNWSWADIQSQLLRDRILLY